MKWDVTPYRDTVMDYAKALLSQDSPSGFTRRAVDTADTLARELGYETRRSRKGNLTILIPGRDHSKTVGLCAHVDTLGLMVRSVTADGRLLITPHRRPPAAHPGRGVLPHLHPVGKGLHRHGPVPVPRRPCGG